MVDTMVKVLFCMLLRYKLVHVASRFGLLVAHGVYCGGAMNMICFKVVSCFGL